MDLSKFFQTYKIGAETPASQSLEPVLENQLEFDEIAVSRQKEMPSSSSISAQFETRDFGVTREQDKKFKKEEVPIHVPDVLNMLDSNEVDKQLGNMQLRTPKRHRQITGQAIKPTSNIITRSKVGQPVGKIIAETGDEGNEQENQGEMPEIDKENKRKMTNDIRSIMENDSDETDSTSFEDSGDEYNPGKKRKKIFVDFDEEEEKVDQQSAQKSSEIPAASKSHIKKEDKSQVVASEVISDRRKLQFSHQNKVDPFSTGEKLFCDEATKRVHSKELREINFKKFKISNNMDIDYSKFEDAARYAPCDFTKKLCLAMGVTLRMEKEKLKRQPHSSADFGLSRPAVEPLKFPATFDPSKITIDAKIMTPAGVIVDYIAPFNNLTVKAVSSCDIDTLFETYMEVFLEEFRKDVVYFLYALPTKKITTYIPLSETFVTIPIDAVLQSLGLTNDKFKLYRSRLTGNFIEKLRICLGNGRSRRPDKALHKQMATDLRLALSDR